MKRWIVVMTTEAKKELTNLLKGGDVNQADIRVLLKWIDDMEEFGPIYIESSIEWNDHSLIREWSGFRSSAFSKSGRVIYRVVKKKVLIEVHKVTADHNYKK